MISVKYTGTFTDHSGYGSANRSYIASLYVAGVDVTAELVVQVPEQTDHGWTGSLCQNLVNRDIDYKIKIIHLTPDMYPRYQEKGKYNIGHLFWETDRLPKEWIDPINTMQEIWASSAAMAELFRSNGVRVPIYFFPQPIDIAEAEKPLERFTIPKHKGFLFYSVFQWIERKNPKGLLQAYWKAFSGRSDVSLLLKTYGNTYSESEYQRIQTDIERWKRETHLVHFPRVLLVTKLLSHEDMIRLHKTADCYVSADHGEGWCRPVQEALLMGKPVVSTARGGIHEYMNRDLYYPIPSTYVPVVEQATIPWYTSEQQWAEVDQKELVKMMQFVFANQQLAQVKGFKGAEYIKETFSYQRVGGLMRDRLEKISKAL